MRSKARRRLRDKGAEDPFEEKEDSEDLAEEEALEEDTEAVDEVSHTPPPSRDYWSLSNWCLTRHHVDQRTKLFVFGETTKPPVPIEFIDVGRRTFTDSEYPRELEIWMSGTSIQAMTVKTWQKNSQSRE